MDELTIQSTFRGKFQKIIGRIGLPVRWATPGTGAYWKSANAEMRYDGSDREDKAEGGSLVGAGAFGPDGTAMEFHEVSGQ